jgi:hypothetical protein
VDVHRAEFFFGFQDPTVLPKDLKREFSFGTLWANFEIKFDLNFGPN